MVNEVLLSNPEASDGNTKMAFDSYKRYRKVKYSMNLEEERDHYHKKVQVDTLKVCQTQVQAQETQGMKDDAELRTTFEYLWGVENRKAKGQ